MSGWAKFSLIPKKYRVGLDELPKSRKEARQLKVTRYFNGKPCSQGHRTFRYTSSSQCALCVAAGERRRRSAALDDKLTGRYKIDDMKFDREIKRLEKGVLYGPGEYDD